MSGVNPEVDLLEGIRLRRVNRLSCRIGDERARAEADGTLWELQQRGCSMIYLAEQLGISPWKVAHLLQERGLRTSNL